MKYLTIFAGMLALAAVAGCEEKTSTQVTEFEAASPSPAHVLSDEEIENIVRRSYQYVAMYNVNNKFALRQGWNTVTADTMLKDHTMTDIARPNNDTLYISCMLDLRKDPMIIDIPAFDSKYVSLMVTAYDHYVNVPMSVTRGDFKKPEKVLFYSARTEGYDGGAVAGIDRNFETTGDFVSAVFRVMPHANDKALFEKIIGQMKSVKVMSLSEFQGRPAKAINDVQFPGVGKTDSDVYENNFVEVMQFVLDHTTFDPSNDVDAAFLSAMKSLGLEPGKATDQNMAARFDGKRFRAVADAVRKSEFSRLQDAAEMASVGTNMFLPKGQISQDILLVQSVIGPIGLPASEALYPPVNTRDGQPMNALNDYVVHMSRDELPPARAFWSLTLYDSANGFFIPNDRKKYSVGENAGMVLNDDGGIDVYVAAEKPAGVPDENWLPINRKDEKLDMIMRIYQPDMEKFKSYKVPEAEIISTH